jgi:DNA-binding MarR family transcriptional regulator
MISEQHGAMIPAPWLESLATRVKLHRSEWRLIALVLAAARPVTARELAKRLKMDYSALKRLTRELVRWRILRRTRDGLVFQPDSAAWEQPPESPRLRSVPP